MTEQTDSGFSLLTSFIAVVILEHITAQELEIYVKIFCQLAVTASTVWIVLWKNKDHKKDSQ